MLSILLYFGGSLKMTIAIVSRMLAPQEFVTKVMSHKQIIGVYEGSLHDVYSFGTIELHAHLSRQLRKDLMNHCVDVADIKVVPMSVIGDVLTSHEQTFTETKHNVVRRVRTQTKEVEILYTNPTPEAVQLGHISIQGTVVEESVSSSVTKRLPRMGGLKECVVLAKTSMVEKGLINETNISDQFTVYIGVPLN